VEIIMKIIIFILQFVLIAACSAYPSLNRGHNNSIHLVNAVNEAKEALGIKHAPRKEGGEVTVIKEKFLKGDKLMRDEHYGKDHVLTVITTQGSDKIKAYYHQPRQGVRTYTSSGNGAVVTQDK